MPELSWLLPLVAPPCSLCPRDFIPRPRPGSLLDMASRDLASVVCPCSRPFSQVDKLGLGYILVHRTMCITLLKYDDQLGAASLPITTSSMAVRGYRVLGPQWLLS